MAAWASTRATQVLVESLPAWQEALAAKLDASHAAGLPHGDFLFPLIQFNRDEHAG